MYNHDDATDVRRANLPHVSHVLECDEGAVHRIWADVLRSDEYVPVDKLKNGDNSYVQIRPDSRVQ